MNHQPKYIFHVIYHVIVYSVSTAVWKTFYHGNTVTSLKKQLLSCWYLSSQCWFIVFCVAGSEKLDIKCSRAGKWAGSPSVISVKCGMRPSSQAWHMATPTLHNTPTLPEVPRQALSNNYTLIIWYSGDAALWAAVVYSLNYDTASNWRRTYGVRCRIHGYTEGSL